jgi:hypothetical protein
MLATAAAEALRGSVVVDATEKKHRRRTVQQKNMAQIISG